MTNKTQINFIFSILYIKNNKILFSKTQDFFTKFFYFN